MANISKNPPKRWWNFRTEFEETEDVPGSPAGAGLPSPMGIRQMSTGRSTGLGPNGTLEADKPTAIRSFAEHEGEFVVNADKVKAAGGPAQINAAVSAIAKPGQPGQAKANTEQEMMARKEVRGLAGYKDGGMVTKPISKSFKDTFAPSGSPRMMDQTTMKKKERVLGLRGYIHGGVVGIREKIKTAFEAAGAQPVEKKPAGGLAGISGIGERLGERIKSGFEEAGFQPIKPAPPTEAKAETPSIGFTAGAGEIPDIKAPPDLPKADIPVTKPPEDLLKPAEPVEPEKPDVTAAPPTTGFIQQGLSALSEAARGESKAFRTMTNRMMNRIAGETAAGQMALNQRLTQMGMGSGAMLAAGANYIQGQGSLRDTLAGAIAESGQKLATQAARDLISQSLAVERFAFDQKKYEDTQELVDFNAALLTKDVDEIGKAYKAMTGRDFDPEELNWWMDHAKDVAEGSKYLNEWDVANDSYLSLLGSDPEKAKEQWNLMKNDPRFANFMKGMVEPDWDKVQAGWDEDRHDSIMGNLAAQITDDVPLWQLTDQIDELLETNTGKTVEEIATEQGITVDEVRQNEYDRIEDQSSPIAQALKFYEGAFEQYFDTPEERRIAKETISEMIATGGIIVGPDGEITTDNDKLMLAWNNPKVQHIFDSRLSTLDKDIIDDIGAGASQADIDAERTSRQNTKDSREAYLESKRASGEDPASFDDWYKAALDGMGDGLTGEELVAFVDKTVPKPPETAIIEGVSQPVTEVEDSPTGFLSGGKFVKKDEDEIWQVVDYDEYKRTTVSKERTLEHLLAYADRDNRDAAGDAAGLMIAAKDMENLKERVKGDLVFDAVLSKAPSIKSFAHKYDTSGPIDVFDKPYPKLGEIYSYPEEGKILRLTSFSSTSMVLEDNEGNKYRIVAGSTVLNPE